MLYHNVTEEKEDRKMKEEKKILSKTKEAAHAVSAKQIFYSAAAAFFVFMLGRGQTVMQTYPFALSYFCAANRQVLPCAVGLLLSSALTGEMPSAHLSGFVLSVLFRLGVNFVSYGKKGVVCEEYKDTLASKVASGIVGTLTVSLIRIISGGFLYYDLLGSLFYVNCTVFMTWAYSLYTDKKYRGSAKYDTGVYAILFSCVMALRGLTLLSLSLSTAAAFFIIYAVSRKKGAAQGTVIGLLCGAAIGVDICPMFGLVGLVSGALSSLPSYLGLLISSATGLFAFTAVQGIGVLSSYLPEAAVASCVFVPLGALLPATVQQNIASAPIYLPIPSSKKEEKTKELCESLLYLSDMFGSLAKKQNRPAVHELCDLLCDTFTENCKGCTQKTACFGKYKISQSPVVRSVAENIYKKGICTGVDLTDEMRCNCYFKDKLMAKINIAVSRLNSEKSKFGKLDVMESDYSSMASLLSACTGIDEDCEVNLELTERIKKEPAFRRIFGDDITVYGKRRLCVIGVTHTSGFMLLSRSDLVRCFESFCACRFSEPEYISDGDRTVIKLSAVPRFTVHAEKRSTVKGGERHNGDSAELFETASELYYGVICDGMGSGDAAALTSGTSVLFLKKLLSCISDKEAVMKCLNNFVCAKGTECFTTADLACIDLHSGKCSFVKCGACASLVIRGDNIYKLASHTPPVGIMKELCAEKLEFQLKHGDTVVMMSDGVCDWLSEPTAIYELLTVKRCGKSPEKLCEEILGMSDHGDDATVCIMDIEDF